MCTSMQVNTHTCREHIHKHRDKKEHTIKKIYLLLPFVLWTRNYQNVPRYRNCWQLQPTSAELNSPFSLTKQPSYDVLWSLKTRIQPRKVLHAACKENNNLSSFLSSGLECYFPAQAGRDVVIQKVDSGVHSCNLTHQICKTLKTCWLQKGNAKPLLLSGGCHP